MSKKRNVYREGDRLNIYLPKGIDPNFLKWLNNRANTSNECLEILMKFANGELQKTGTIIMEGLLEKLALLSSMPMNEIKNLNVTNQPSLNNRAIIMEENNSTIADEPTDINYSTDNVEKEMLDTAKQIDKEKNNENQTNKIANNAKSSKKFSGGLNLNKGFKSKNFKNTGLHDLDKNYSGNSIFNNVK